MNRFNKSERLKSKKSINQLFASRKQFVSNNIKVYWNTETSKESKIQVLISVPKNIMSKAINRNIIKRYFREAYRRNKLILKPNKQIINIGFVYLSSEIMDFNLAEKKIKLILHRLNDEI